MPKTTAFVSHYDCSRHDTGWGHPDHQGRLPGLMRHVYRDMLTLFEPLLEVEGRHASREELLLAHSGAYLDRVEEWVEAAVREGRPLQVQGRLTVSGASWDASVAAVGSALTAVDEVLGRRVRNAFAAVRPPGHDAGYDRPGRMGLLNPVAAAVEYLLETARLERVLVVAWEGDEVVLRREEGRAIRSISVPPGQPREEPTSPGGSVAGRGDTFLATLRDRLSRSLHDFRPDFIILAAGFGGLETDPSGVGPLRSSEVHPATVMLREAAEQACGGRLVSILGSGYDPDELGAAVVQHLRGLAALPPA
jgi:acetoin utilization deacetylase AcuC-like enzyme